MIAFFSLIIRKRTEWCEVETLKRCLNFSDLFLIVWRQKDWRNWLCDHEQVNFFWVSSSVKWEMFPNAELGSNER